MKVTVAALFLASVVLTVKLQLQRGVVVVSDCYQVVHWLLLQVVY